MKFAVPVLKIELEEFKSAFKGMKNWKATGPVIDYVCRNVEGWWVFFQNSKTRMPLSLRIGFT